MVSETIDAKDADLMQQATAFTPVGKAAAALEGVTPEPELARSILAGLEQYPERMTSERSVELARLEDATREENWTVRYDSSDTSLRLQQNMLSGHLEGQFLAMLIALGRARRVLEIGLFTGYSALAMAEALPDSGEVVALEIDQYAADFARRHFDTSAHGDKITILVAPAMHSLEKLGETNEPFDFVFIDADKPGYIAYYEAILKMELLSADGLICVDNTLLGGDAYRDTDRSPNGQAIAAFNDHVANDPRTVQVLLPVRDGVTLIRRAC